MYQNATELGSVGNIKIDGVLFSKIGYGMLKTANILSYKTQPYRLDDFSMPDINLYETRIIPQLEIGFNFILAEEFWLLRNILLRKNEHTVQYYDNDFGKVVTHKMYVEPDTLKTFFAKGGEVLGTQNYTITFIATMNNEPIYNLTYNSNTGTLKTINDFSMSTTYKYGDIVKKDSVYYKYINDTASAGNALNNSSYWLVVNSDFLKTNQYGWGENYFVQDYSNYVTPPTGKKFKCYNTMADGLGMNYYIDDSVNIFEDTILYAIWE